MNNPLTVLRLLSVALGLVALVVAVLEARGRGRFPLATVVARWYGRPRNVSGSLPGGFVLGAALVGVPMAVHLVWDEAALSVAGPMTPRWLLLALGSLLLKGAFVFFEEVISRGAVITLLRRRLSWPIAVLIAGAAFALSHPGRSPISLAILGLDGVLFGIAFVTTGSLWLPSMIHLGKNLLVWLVEGGGTLTLVPGPVVLTGTATGLLELATTAAMVLAASWVMAARHRRKTPGVGAG